MIQLHVEPHLSPLSWKEFVLSAPSYSLALDGYVADETKFDRRTHIGNINHHEKVSRLSTRATCAQVLMAIRLDLMSFFQNKSGNPQIHIYVNDCDEDVCVSYFLLKHFELAQDVTHPLLNQLVDMEDTLDSTSAGYPFPKDLPLLKQIAWVFEPYRNARFQGKLTSKDPVIYQKIIEDVEQRILKYLSGQGKSIELDTLYEKIGGGKNWSMVHEIGIYPRTGMWSDGIRAFVSVKDRGNGTWDYVIGKSSPFINFDVRGIMNHLNMIEHLDHDKWGGADIIGGSPRVQGSHLNPQELEQIINEYLE